MNLEERQRQVVDVMKKVERYGFPNQKKTWRASNPDLYDKAVEEIQDEDAAEKTRVRNAKIDIILES